MDNRITHSPDRDLRATGGVSEINYFIYNGNMYEKADRAMSSPNS